MYMPCIAITGHGPAVIVPVTVDETISDPQRCLRKMAGRHWGRVSHKIWECFVMILIFQRYPNFSKLIPSFRDGDANDR
jgi:hypothetical protein